MLNAVLMYIIPKNNNIANLCVMKDEQTHQLAHRSIDRLIRPLLRAGVIEFTGDQYRLAITWMDKYGSVEKSA